VDDANAASRRCRNFWHRCAIHDRTIAANVRFLAEKPLVRSVHPSHGCAGDIGASEERDVRPTSNSGSAIRGLALWVMLLAAAAGCGGDSAGEASTPFDGGPDATATGPHGIAVTDVASFQACSTDADCHLVYTSCDCHAVNQEVSYIDDPVKCFMNGCTYQGSFTTPCVSGTCSMVLNTPSDGGADATTDGP
jgi:hypothetical protein